MQWVNLLKIAQPFMAGKLAKNIPVPKGRQKLFRPLRDFRVEIPLPSAKALGYFQQKSVPD